MASTTQKWFIGCGIGCGFLILIIAIIVGGTIFAVKDVIKDGKSIEESNDALVEAFGTPDEFTPTADGAITADRMEIFLKAREETTEPRTKMANILHTLDDESDEGGRGAMAKLKAGLTMIPAILSYINTRNEVLLENGMGDGEYTYIYTMAYFAYLDKDLTDGPSFQMSGDDDGDEDGGGMNWRVQSGSSDKKVRSKREKNVRRQMHRLQMSFLDNQIASLGEFSGSEDLKAALDDEREAMLESRRRLLWEEGLPPAIEASLEPFAGELNDSYLPVLNVIEIGLANTN